MSANEKNCIDWAGESTPSLIDESMRAGLAVLWRAYICAQDSGANVWDFALRTSRLYEAGMSSSDLRWMIAKGFAQHGEETSGYDDPHRLFRRSSGYFFNNHTCLILTPSGAALAEHVFRETVRTPQASLAALAVCCGNCDSRKSAALGLRKKHRSDVRPETSLGYDSTRIIFGGVDR